jgi:CHAT domain-containing protein
VLVTESPNDRFPANDAGYRDVAWLARGHAITVLPSVASLSALHRSGKSGTADQPFIGFGNPLLEGNPDIEEAKERAQLAHMWQRCSDVAERPQVLRNVAQGFSGIAASNALSPDSFARVLVRTIRAQPPLPETAVELCAAARALHVEEGNIDRVVHLGGTASETAIRNMNEHQELEHYRVVQFATHGVLAGQLARRWGGVAEPGLILTPPAEMTDLEKDDGYLSASEIAQLKLNADWVVLSACNTAAGDNSDAEALSGLARAFFYAGARSVLVSHWALKSSVAVKLTTGAFAAREVAPEIGRAEALRRSMAALIQDPASAELAHPAAWGPFVLIGEDQ